MREGTTILIVDDEPCNVDYLGRELADFGYGHDQRHEWPGSPTCRRWMRHAPL
jgi:hypothetical protein